MSTLVSSENVPNGTMSNGLSDKPDRRSGSSKPAGKKPRQLRPEEVPFKLQIEEKTRIIAKLQTELSSINNHINSNRGGMGANDERSLIKNRLDEIQNRINTLDIKRSAFLDELDNKQRDIRKKNKYLSDLKSASGYKNEQEIDHQIKFLEGLMMTSSLSLKEEKSMMSQLQQLRNTKASLERLKMESLNTKDSVDGVIMGVKSNLDSLREEMNMLRKAKREESQKLFNLNESKKKSMDSMKSYFTEKSRLLSEIQEHMNDKRNLMKQLEELNNEYYTKQKLLQQQKMKKQQEERERRNLENEVRQLQSQLDNCDFLPYDKEVRLIQQVLTFLATLDSTHKDASQPSKEVEQKKDVDNLVKDDYGMRLVPKKDRDEYFISPKTKKEKTKSKDKAAKFKIDMATMSYFESCGVDPPTCLESIPSCREKLQSKLDHYNTLRNECNVEDMKKQISQKLEQATKKLNSLTKSPKTTSDAAEASNTQSTNEVQEESS
ncbi:conserved hypothetical protein [Theileria orientalis strain Shintoku]|uniref:Uncharacterized protein n=1 Tax=Theileria orientalis strain Shintoku TaxID=869250 RepID=J4CDN3_THEOR|nr:conserved hypothetical protein [Theileria orientalis strain Shintoku]PVC53776.1 hypothetical protein MACL_00003515 [Theileria orientalis]BAM41442.1 conserved hypothetical protein [Theileria orientalis strain Shintoku]|eukprot:XP_009691743.1 conserved hypothetical protein [Theileria orientalis strain Shintoku]